MSPLPTKVRRFRFWWHLSTAYLNRYKIQIFSLLFIVIISAFTFSKIFQILLRNNVLTIGYVGTFKIDTIPSEIFAPATRPLIAASEDGKPIADLASHWTVADDGKTYVVFLRDNLLWHDLTPVTAADISIAITDVKITALNNKTIEFRLPNPIVYFPLLLDKPVFKGGSFFGTGQYRIVDIEEVQGFIKRISMHPKNNKLPRLQLRFYQSESQLQQALKIGEVKVGYINSTSSFASYQNFQIKKKEDPLKIVTIFYNNNDGLLASKDVRQALNYGINLKNFQNLGKLATGPIQFSSWVYNGEVNKYVLDLKKAKEHLEKANVEKPKIVLSYTQELEETAQLIKKDWEALGIEIDLKKEKSIPKNFQTLLVINKLEPDPDQYNLWHSTQKTTNITGYKNVKIDKLLEDARITQDETNRKELYLEFQRFLVEDAPAAFLYHPYNYLITYKNAQDLIKKVAPYQKDFQ